MEQQVAEFVRYLDSLFNRAFRSSPFDTLCTVLRVGGWMSQDWDPFVESEEAFKDYDWLLDKARSEHTPFAAWRVALLTYCHAVEMTVPHVFLANLLRIVAGEPYVIYPFADLLRKKKKDPFATTPPSATAKINRIRSLADKAGEPKLVEILDSFFDDQIRNAFSHSDYVLTESGFRWTESGPASEIPLDKLTMMVETCFAFYSALLACQPRWKTVFGKLNRFHKLPRYEVLELVKDQEGPVCGFRMHFSNGSSASYSRTSEGSNPVNVISNRDGTITFMIGVLDDLEPVWKLNGIPVNDWEALNKSG